MEKKLLNAYPAVHWNEATPLGNGVMGATVYGCVYDERILLNHEALYNGHKDDTVPDLSESLAEVRSLLDAGKYREAEELYPERMKKCDYDCRCGRFHPAFDLHLLLQTDGAFTDYARQLDMEHGVCTVSYRDKDALCTRQAFCSITDKVFVLRICKESPFTMKCALVRHNLKDSPDASLTGHLTVTAKDRYIHSRVTTEGGLDYSGMVKLLHTDGTYSIANDTPRKIDMTGEPVFQNYLRIENAREVCLLVTVSPETQPFAQMQANLDALTWDFDTLLQRQKEAFSKRFNATRLTLSQQENISNEQLLLNGYSGEMDLRMVEKMADFGRYLLISSSTDCMCPANLQGLWNGDYNPAWLCTYFLNENVQMCYWQAGPGGLAESMLPLFELMERCKDDFRSNAKNLFGCRGLLLPLYMDNRGGKKNNAQAHCLYWTASSAWVSAMFYEYYLFTGDDAFLRNRAYPFMKECALFYEDFLVEDEIGKLKSYPSNSPENRANGTFAGAREISVSINATMDIALVKELLTNLVSSAKKLNVDEDKQRMWSAMLAKLPDYAVNQDGALQEWLHPDFVDNYQHRHQSHIYPLFPGFEIDAQSGALYSAAATAVEKRLRVGLSEQTGWSLAHMANIFARMGDGERAMECLSLLSRFATNSNLLTCHNDWRNMGVTVKVLLGGRAPFQVDANMGFAAAVYEMLAFSKPGKLVLLPALPALWREGEMSGLHTRVGCVCKLRWNECGLSVTLTAKRDTAFDLSCKNLRVVTTDARLKNSALGENWRYVTLREGEELSLQYQ